MRQKMRQKISSWVSQSVSWSKSEILLVKGIISQDVIWEPQDFPFFWLQTPASSPGPSMQLICQRNSPVKTVFPSFIPCNFSAGETGWLESGPTGDQSWCKVDSQLCGEGGEECNGTKGLSDCLRYNLQFHSCWVIFSSLTWFIIVV